ncbi:mast cell protease 1A-like, partial [Chanos chanos]|uniref:Mast cell protease 1A-like n=1 Tax=Chanos chanos TaxID=29144 RepID=A0A6J2W7B6_CHACN
LSAHVDVGIINGTIAKPHSRPYMVSVQKRHHVCGGFLVGDSFVMTAAHCWDMGGELTVVVGYQDLSSRESCTGRMTVKRYHVHPGYDSSTLENDIMILQLDQKVKLIPNAVQPIPLPRRNEDVAARSRCSVAGWGRISTNGPISSRLREANVQIFDREQCRQRWGELITDHMLCASGGAGFCQGDSGGPLVCGGKAVGVVSFNQKGNCDKPIVPNVYTNISSFLPWINAIIEGNP